MTLSIEQQAARRGRVGSTDSPAIVGYYYPGVVQLSKMKNICDVWMRICHGVDLPTSSVMSRGTRVEPALRSLYREKVGEVGESPGALVHPKHAWMVGSPDSLSEKEVVEFKTVSHWVAAQWGKAYTDEVPSSYKVQTQHLMAITGKNVTTVFAAFGTDYKDENGEDDFAIERTELYIVKRDEELIATIIECGLRFMSEHVIPMVSPPLKPVKNIRKWAAITKTKEQVYE